MRGMRGVSLLEVVRTVHMKLDLARLQHRVVDRPPMEGGFHCGDHENSATGQTSKQDILWLHAACASLSIHTTFGVH